MVENLILNGHEVAVVSPNTQNLYQLLKHKGIKTFSTRYVPVSIHANSHLWMPKNLLKILYHNLINKKATKDIENLVKEFDPDIIHENTSVTDIGYRLSKKLKKPYVIHIREYGDKDFNWHNIGLRSRLKENNTYRISICCNLLNRFHIPKIA